MDTPEEIKLDVPAAVNSDVVANPSIGAKSADRVRTGLSLDACLIFAACLIVYLANGTAISVGDSVPNTLFGLNLLENCRLDFDNFRGSYLATQTAHWFTESPSGHLNSAYPLGPSIVSFPICLCYWAFLKVSHIPVLITSPAFEPYRLTFEHIAASIIAALGAVMFYLTGRVLFQRKTSLITTGVFAFATNSWVTSSQGLWQHGSSNLVLLGATYSLLRVNREAAAKGRDTRLLIAGVLYGLLPVIRPSNAIFLLAAAIYCLLVYREEAIIFLLGLSSCLLGLLYNFFFFGNLLGGYQSLFSPEVFSPALFKTAFFGSLLSPSRGLFVYCPVLIFSFVGFGLLLKRGSAPSRDEKLILAMTAASVAVCSLYFFYLAWWAGHSFGPRFMTEALPMSVFLMNYFVDYCLVAAPQTRVRRLSMYAFLLLVAYSALVQVVGAFGIGGKYWNIIPLNVDQYQWRLWSLEDTQLERHWHALTYRLQPRWLKKMLGEEPAPLANTADFTGKILEAGDERGLPLANPIVISARDKKAVRMEVQNTGGIKWIGYGSGREHTETYAYVEITFQKRGKHENISGGKLYVADSIGPGEKSWSIGEVSFPLKPGEYQMVARLRCDNVPEIQNKSQPMLLQVRDEAK